MKKVIFIAIFLIISTPVYAEEFDLNGGYHLSITASTQGNQVQISGRIRGGEDCANLRLDIFAYNDKGNIAQIVTAVKNVGGSGSKIVEGADTLILPPTGKWAVRSAYGNCVKK